MMPNRLIAEALAAGALPGFEDYPAWRPEVPYGVGNRIDFLLSGPGERRCYLEVKNVHLVRRPGLAEFPDCVTARGARHLAALAAMVAEGHRAVMLYLVQREDCARVDLARDLDPAYAQAFARAAAAGVEAMALACRVTPDAITLDRAVPFGH